MANIILEARSVVYVPSPCVGPVARPVVVGPLSVRPVVSFPSSPSSSLIRPSRRRRLSSVRPSRRPSHRRRPSYVSPSRRPSVCRRPSQNIGNVTSVARAKYEPNPS